MKDLMTDLGKFTRIERMALRGLIAVALIGGSLTGVESRAQAPLTCNVRTFGAKGDGHHLDTPAIQAAVAACQGKGGVVDFPAGTYSSGTIRLGGRMTL